jgi:galactokinase
MSFLGLEEVCAEFSRHHGGAPEIVVRAPGRVNLIGEHTDYNDGYVLPVAIDRGTCVAARPRQDASVRVVAADLHDQDEFSLDHIDHSTDHPWSEYIRGVAAELVEAGHRLRGADLLVRSNLPRGSGLSSSAALEVAAGHTFCRLNGLELSGKELALLGQRAENTFVGVQCGIMDQFVVALGRADHALLIDCRDLEYRAVAVPPQVKIVVCDSQTERSLANSAFNQRRAECAEAVRLFRHWYPAARSLRDLTLDQLREHEQEIPDPVRARARHVISENERTLKGAAALERGDVSIFGELMDESHSSLRHDYEVSSPEIDVLTEAARGVAGCFGSRLTGAGFGGCTVSLVEESAIAQFRRRVAEAYLEATGREALFYVCRASDGVRQLSPRREGARDRGRRLHRQHRG